MSHRKFFGRPSGKNVFIGLSYSSLPYALPVVTNGALFLKMPSKDFQQLQNVPRNLNKRNTLSFSKEKASDWVMEINAERYALLLHF